MGSKTSEEIFYQDYKTFAVGDVKVGIGQINSMNPDELEAIGERLLPYLKEVEEKSGLDVVYFMLTSILDESTTVICSEKNMAVSLLSDAFPAGRSQGIGYYLEGVVSRKKQMVPSLMLAMQN